ncbi:MAG: hypothetical protein AAFY58_03165 [Planctomycetota bacterium]
MKSAWYDSSGANTINASKTVLTVSVETLLSSRAERLCVLHSTGSGLDRRIHPGSFMLSEYPPAEVDDNNGNSLVATIELRD